MKRAIHRGLGRNRLRGIRYRLAVALALALFPILLLGAFQVHSRYRIEEADRREDLQTAAASAVVAAKARLESTTVLLKAIRADGAGPFCDSRLDRLVDDLDGMVTGLARVSATGQIACASGGAEPALPPSVASAPWFTLLRGGQSAVLGSSPRADGGSLVVVAEATRRPMGGFDGAVVATLPLDSLRPDTSGPGLPDGVEVALTDEQGRLLTATDAAAFALEGRPGPEGWVERARASNSAVFDLRDADGRRRVYAGSVLTGQDVFVLLSAPAPSLWSWASLNPVGLLLTPLLAWLAAFAAVMLVSDRIVIRWLDYLERIASIYAKGRFNIRPVQAEHAPAEIASFGRALDELADSITTRDQALTTSIAEKDALMREIHHRVKNNLQIISSLLSIQQRALTDEPAKAAVNDTRQRITALALIYRTLYQSDDLRYADARMFITDLVGQLLASDAARGVAVASSIEADSLVVDPDKLAPLALWLVEAVTNAQKHAFGKAGGGKLAVRFKVRGDTSVLEVEDDGPGVSESEREGVGRTLMGAFARQLRGDVQLVPASSGGAIARLTFATPEAIAPTDPADLGTARVG